MADEKPAPGISQPVCAGCGTSRLCLNGHDLRVWYGRGCRHARRIADGVCTRQRFTRQLQGGTTCPIPEGETALLQFLAENIRYPADALEKNIRGSVVIGFTVDKTGNVTDVKVLKPLHPSCDAEAVRVVKMLKKFKPAKTGGKEVAIRMVLPIRFQSK